MAGHPHQDESPRQRVGPLHVRVLRRRGLGGRIESGGADELGPSAATPPARFLKCENNTEGATSALMLRGRSTLVQTFLQLAPEHKLRAGPVCALTQAGGWGLHAVGALPVGTTVFFEAPRLLVSNRGAHSSPLWALVEEALKSGFVEGTTAPAAANRPPLLAWTHLQDAPHAVEPLSGVNEGFESRPIRLPANLREPWLEWDSTDCMEAGALAIKYGTSWHAVAEAYVDLARTSLCTVWEAAGFYTVLATMNHACVANVEVFDVFDTDKVGTKQVKTLCALKAGEELRSCYAAARWHRPASVALRREYLKNKFGFWCTCSSCVHGSLRVYGTATTCADAVVGAISLARVAVR